MREERLIVICKRRRKYNSYQGEISPYVPNKIERDFHADKPNQKWLTDITELAGKVYLSVLVDCFDGLLPGWTISMIPDSVLVNTMPDQAIAYLPERGSPTHPFRQRLPLSVVWLDRTYEESGSGTFNV